MSNDIHTTQRADGTWANRREGDVRASGLFDTQQAAIDAARDIAKNQNLEHFIHGTDGKIRERNSYGSDPVRTKG
jgi:hypothetical protein